MSKHLFRFLAPLLLVGAVGCSAPQSGDKGDGTVKEAPKDEPQCFQGCMFNSANECTTEGNVMDWSSSKTETIECDPRCCEAGAKNMSGTTDPDSDGIFDDADQCPDKPEDHDSFQDDDGCPDPDNDQDQILDDADLCPLDAEDVDGFQDEDGCPDP